MASARLEEELGLRVEFEDLIPLGRRVGIYRIGDFVDCQICHVFFYECDQPLEAYQYQSDEIAGLAQSCGLTMALRLFSGDVDSVTAAAVGLGSAEIAISREDFIPSIDNYVVKILILAQRYFRRRRRTVDLRKRSSQAPGFGGS